MKTVIGKFLNFNKGWTKFYISYGYNIKNSPKKPVLGHGLTPIVKSSTARKKQTADRS